MKDISNNNENKDNVYLQAFCDDLYGRLFVAEEQKHVPFPIKRFYFINQLTDPVAVRGKHAHKELEQVIFCVNGSFELGMDDGSKKWNVSMDNPSIGTRLRKKVWHTMTKFSSDCIILVVADNLHNEYDYIRDYQEFLEHVKTV